LVKSAVGFDEERGDVVQVENIQFDRSGVEDDLTYFKEAESNAMWAGVINKGILFASVLVALFFVRSLLKNMGGSEGDGGLMSMLPNVATGALPPGVAYPQGQQQFSSGAPQKIMAPEEPEMDEDLFIAKLSPEARAKIKAKDKMTTSVVDYAKQSPEDAAKLVHSWVSQPGGGRR